MKRYGQNCSVITTQFSQRKPPFLHRINLKNNLQNPPSVLLVGTGVKASNPHAAFTPAIKQKIINKYGAKTPAPHPSQIVSVGWLEKQHGERKADSPPQLSVFTTSCPKFGGSTTGYPHPPPPPIPPNPPTPGTPPLWYLIEIGGTGAL
jgi:hypothetical protein